MRNYFHHIHPPPIPRVYIIVMKGTNANHPTTFFLQRGIGVKARVGLPALDRVTKSLMVRAIEDLP